PGRRGHRLPYDARQMIETRRGFVLRLSAQHGLRYVLEHDGGAERLPLTVAGRDLEHFVETEQRILFHLQIGNGPGRVAWLLRVVALSLFVVGREGEPRLRSRIVLSSEIRKGKCAGAAVRMRRSAS